MAKAQQRGVNAVTISMIVFVALWLASTVFLVILYTDQEDLKRDNADLRARKNKVISRDEERSLEFFGQASERGPTVVGLMEEERRTTADLATGDASDNAAIVQSKRDQILETIMSEELVGNPRSFDDVSLLEATTLLYEAFKTNSALLAQAEERAAALEDRVESLISENTEQQSDFEQRLTQVGDQLAEAERGHTAFREERNEAVSRIERNFEDRLAENDADLNGERTRRTAAEDALAKLKERYQAQQEKFVDVAIGPDALATARKPDGVILTAIPGDELVYINLGRKDRLTLGLRFAVYSSETGIPPDGKGKGRIEVVSIFGTSAECRILKTFGNQVIFEDDLIANPIYDRSRPVTFLVIGDFDLDHDGRCEPSGAATIEAQITNWGGTVQDEVTALTDFVVVGASPPRPKAIGDVSQEEAEQMESIRRRYDRYVHSLETARDLSIPVMTQSVFMSFLGY
jgi:hypothetical protein